MYLKLNNVFLKNSRVTKEITWKIRIYISNYERTKDQVFGTAKAEVRRKL